MITNKPLLCPSCGNGLKVTHHARYEDLSEHVSDPNGTPSLKAGYQCVNTECAAHKYNVSWIADGGLYIPYRDLPEGISSSMIIDEISKGNPKNSSSAVNSWEYFYDGGQAEIERQTKYLKIGSWKIKFSPQVRGGKNIETQYEPSWYRWNVEYIRNNVYVVPVYRMIKFSLRTFNRTYRYAIKSERKHDIEKCLNEINCRTSWGTKDDRFYAKATSVILRYLFPGKVYKIRQLAAKNNMSLT